MSEINERLQKIIIKENATIKEDSEEKISQITKILDFHLTSLQENERKINELELKIMENKISNL